MLTYLLLGTFEAIANIASEVLKSLLKAVVRWKGHFQALAPSGMKISMH
jgi:hypothetical protein